MGDGEIRLAALCDTGGCEVGGGVRDKGGVLELTTVELLGGLCISVDGASLGGGDLLTDGAM